MKYILILFFLFLSYINNSYSQETITISGKVTDFEGNPVDSSLVEVFYKDYRNSLTTLTGKDGRYSMVVPKGKYIAMAAMRMDEYPIAGSVLPENEQRLEFWGYNVPANEDIEINARYHRLEVYGVNIFRVQGGHPAYAVYFRPMSLTRFLSFSKEELSHANLAPSKEFLDVQVYFDDQPVKINSIQEIDEYVDEGKCFGYLLFVDLPKETTSKPYQVVRVVAEDKENGDKGESIYFREKDEYN